MTKCDGSLSLHGEVTPLMELFQRRRSHRKYGQGEATPAQVAYIEVCVQRFVEGAGFFAPRLVIMGRGPEFDAVLRAAMQGAIGKVNPWLRFARASHLILCGAVYPDVAAGPDVESAIKQAAMAMQIAVLAATELGLATCWMAGINHEKVEEAHPLDGGARLIAISPLGLPAERMGLSWDAVAFHLVSKRRKPLDELWMREKWSRQ